MDEAQRGRRIFTMFLVIIVIVPAGGAVVAHEFLGVGTGTLATISLLCLLVGAFTVICNSPLIVRLPTTGGEEELVIFIIGWAMGAATLMMMLFHALAQMKQRGYF